MKRNPAKKSQVRNSSNTPIFSGEYRVSVSRNRVTLPEKIYSQLTSVNGLSEVWITRSPEGCIVVVPGKFWDCYCGAVTEGKPASMKDELLKTSIAPATTVSLGSQRRFTIPYSFIVSPLEGTKRVVMVGLSRWIEIWPEEEWERNLAQFEKRGEKA